VSTRVRNDPSSRLPFDPPSNETGVLEDAPAPAPHAPSPFVELFVRSNFSFLQGATAPEKLVFGARELGYDAVGLCDLDGFYGAVRALEQSERDGIRLVLGCELTLDPEPSGEGEEPPFATVFLHVATSEGYENACWLMTESHARHPKGRAASPRARERAASEDDPLAHNTFAGIPLGRVLERAGGLWATLRPSRALVRAVARGGAHEGAKRAIERASREVERLKDAFGARASLLAVRHLDGEDRARLSVLRALSKRSGVPLVAGNAPLYATPAEKPLLDVLHCIREGKTLDEAGRDLLPN
jgi:error-prone DNA polymerase